MSLTRFAAVLAAVGLGATAAFADVVKDVKIRVMDNIKADASDVLAFCAVKPGAQVNQENISKDVRSLLDSGRFSYAGVELERADGGVNVIYVISRRYRFQEPLAIKGNDYVSERKIRKYAALKNGDYIDDAILATKAGNIRDEYIKRYFPDVKVGILATPLTNSVGFAEVTITIEEGERQKIRNFCFTNNPSIEAEDLRLSFDEYPWYNPIGWFVDRPTSKQDLEDARAKALQVYQDRGYLDAEVSPCVPVKVGNGKIDMLFNVKEGDLYTVEGTAIRGVKLFQPDDVLSGAKLKNDQIAGQQTLLDAAKRVKDYYGGRGYIETTVKPVKDMVAGKPGRVFVTFDVKEGTLAYIRNIEIRGNNKTKDKVIRREITVNPGEIMNEVKIEQTEKRIKNLGYFSEVRHYYENPTLSKGASAEDANKKTLVYDVTEQRTGNFMVGVGLSTVDSYFGYGEISQSNFDILNWPNFTGGGQKARVGVEYGPRRQTFEASWTEPWLLDYPIALDLDAYRRLRWTDQYDDVRTGADAGLSYPIFFGRLGVRYTLEQVDMQDVDNNLWYSDPQRNNELGRYFEKEDDEYSGNLNSIGRLYWTHDTRDQAFVPTKGYKSLIYGEIAENGLGDNAFYKVGVSHRQYFPLWFKHVLMLRLRADTIDTYAGGNDDGLPIYERLFLGGPRSVRGVTYRDIGPKIYRAGDHAPIGGQTLGLATAEYTIPIFKAVRGAVFCDAGSVGEDAWGNLGNFCVSAGLGLRIDIPGFPIRLDVAKPFVTDDDYTDEQIFSFSIGFE